MFEPRVIFDNAGGITLQLPGFAHTYHDVDQAACDIKEWILRPDVSDWEGHELKAGFDPTETEIANGGYRIFSISDLVKIKEHAWSNVYEVITSLQDKLSDVNSGRIH